MWCLHAMSYLKYYLCKHFSVLGLYRRTETASHNSLRWTHSSMVHCRLARTSNTTAGRMGSSTGVTKDQCGRVPGACGFNCSKLMMLATSQDSRCFPTTFAASLAAFMVHFPLLNSRDAGRAPSVSVSASSVCVVPSGTCNKCRMHCGCCATLAATQVQGSAPHVHPRNPGAGAAASTAGGHVHAGTSSAAA